MMHEFELAHFESVVNTLPENAHVVEFGSGGSTRWLAWRLQPPARIDSIEHNPDWYQTTTKALANVEHVRVHLCPPELNADRYKFAQPEEEMPAGLTRYLNPPVDWSDVSLVLVDGIARAAVLALMLRRLPTNTPVLLHDYTGRELWYDWVLPDYRRIELTHSLLELRT